jgi:hypothetical protein
MWCRETTVTVSARSVIGRRPPLLRAQAKRLPPIDTTRCATEPGDRQHSPLVEPGVGLSIERASQHSKHLSPPWNKSARKTTLALPLVSDLTRLLIQRLIHGRLEGNRVRERLFRPGFLARFADDVMKEVSELRTRHKKLTQSGETTTKMSKEWGK